MGKAGALKYQDSMKYILLETISFIGACTMCDFIELFAINIAVSLLPCSRFYDCQGWPRCPRREAPETAEACRGPRLVINCQGI